MKTINGLIISQSPHVTKKGRWNTSVGLMLNVIIALLPAVVAAIYFFGFMVLINIVACIIFCAGFELLYGMTEKKSFSIESLKKSSIFDLSCVISGIILALNLPATINLFGADSNFLIILSTLFADFLGSFIAIVIAKMLFGGLGRNFVNPALLGRVFLLICFTNAMTTVAQANGVGLNAVTGATWLASGSEVTGSSLMDMFFGNTPTAAVGETCSAAIFIGFVYLCVTKTIDYKLPLTIVAGVFVFAFVYATATADEIVLKAILFESLAHVLSGGLLFGAVFMATDYATSPNTQSGLIIYGLGIAVLTMLIRLFGTAFPEGVSFAILIMNIVTPILDKYVIPRPFGHKRGAL